MAEPRLLKLQSPAYGEAIFYKWPLVNTKKHDEATEIAETIKLVCEDFPELKFAVENFILKDYEPTDYESMNRLCQRYNKAIKNILQLWKGRAPPPHMFKPAKKELLRHVINLCYSHAIKEPEKLNIYEPFSPEVYGETSFDMVAQILEECQNSTEETFIDLGSGVGQVVLQAAATNKYKECIGIEKADTPAMYAQAMDQEFRKWMDWFGKTYTDFTLEKGDFLEDKWTETVNNSGFVFVNNFAFGPLVNHHLKQKFQQMKEGAKIISSREFCPLNFKFNKRNLSELGAMMRVTELKPKSEEQTVSWTGNIVSYYLHIVDRTRLEKYFSILKKRKEGRELDEDELSLYSESNLSMDTTGTSKHEETLEDNLDDLYLGTTTRHQWQVLNKTIEQSRKDAKPLKKNKKKEKKKKKIAIHDTEEDEDEDQDYVEHITPFDEKPPRGRAALKKSGNVKLKDKILQKYGYQKMKKSLMLPSTATIAPTVRLSSFSRHRKNKGLSISSSPSATDSEETDSASEIDVEADDDNNNKIKRRQQLKLKKMKKEKMLRKKKKIGIQFQSEKRPIGNDRICTAVRNIGRKEKKEETKKQKQIDTNPTPIENLPKEFLDGLDKDIDAFYDSMKKKAKDFIRRMNTKEYAARLKIMIECEKTKKKLLQREVAELEQTVQQLITSGISNFTTRLGELDLAVKTPLELLTTSKELAEKRQQLEDKVINMEVEVLNLEEKYRRNCNAREQMGGTAGMELLDEEVTSEGLDDQRDELTSKLCGSILSQLNHRRHLLDKQSSLNEQISILEKIASPTALDEQDHTEEDVKSKERPKSRPVAFVPPRMLSDDKQSTVSPETLQPEVARRPRGRPKKKVCEPTKETQSREENNNNVISAESIVQQQQTLSSPPQYTLHRVAEERAPIVFPKTQSNNSDLSSAEFLRASSELLNSKGKWRPLNEVSDEKKSTIDNASTGVSLVKNQERSISLDKKASRVDDTAKSIEDKIRVSDKIYNVESIDSSQSRQSKEFNRPQSNIYDNLKLTFSQQYDLLNRSLASSISSRASEHIMRTIPQPFVSRTSSPNINLSSSLNSSQMLSYGSPGMTQTAPSLITTPFVSTLTTPSALKEDAKMKGEPKLKGKRGRKRKSDTINADMIVPIHQKHPVHDKVSGSTVFNRNTGGVDINFSKSPLEKLYQPLPKGVPLFELPTTKQKQMQPVITLNPVPHYLATGQPCSVVVPPSVPSRVQTVSHRQTNLEILKQAALAALPEKLTLSEPFQTLSTPTKHQVIAPSPVKIPGIGESGKYRMPELKEILPHTIQSPMNSHKEAVFALHNRAVEHTKPVCTKSGPHSYVPIIASSVVKDNKPNVRGLHLNLERQKLTPALNDVIFGNQTGHHSEVAPAQQKCKRSKKESPNPKPVSIPSAMQSPGVPTVPNDLIRSMLLSSSQVITPQTLLVVNSNGHHTSVSNKPKEGHPRILTNLPHASFPVVQTFAAPAPLVIVPFPNGKNPQSTSGGKTPQSSNASPTFPPPKAK